MVLGGLLRPLSQSIPKPTQLLPPALCRALGATTTTASTSSPSPSAAGPAQKRILYAGHTPISPAQRVGLTIISAVTAFADPERADMVAALGETTGQVALRSLHRRMMADPQGRLLLQERPQMTAETVDLAALAALPKGTFGRAYADFMGGNGFTVDSRLPVKFVDDPALAYVMARYRQVHDLWHVLSGLPPSIEGEVALKWFEMVQTGLPVAAVSALVGGARVPSSAERSDLVRRLIPWAVRSGRRCVPLLNVWYEQHWGEDLGAFRERLRFEPAPAAAEHN